MARKLKAAKSEMATKDTAPSRAQEARGPSSKRHSVDLQMDHSFIRLVEKSSGAFQDRVDRSKSVV